MALQKTKEVTAAVSMEKAIERYLSARQNWRCGPLSPELTSAYCAANDFLFAAFASDFSGGDSTILPAFYCFRGDVSDDQHKYRSPTHAFCLSSELRGLMAQSSVPTETMECPLCLGAGHLKRAEVLERLGAKDFARVAQLSAEEAFRLLLQKSKQDEHTALGSLRD